MKKFLFSTCLFLLSTGAMAGEVFTCSDATQPIKHEILLSESTVLSYKLNESSGEWEVFDAPIRINVLEGNLVNSENQKAFKYTLKLESGSVITLYHYYQQNKVRGAYQSDASALQPTEFKECSFEYSPDPEL